VVINGTQVLTNFDIFATAGAQHKAIAKIFSAAADTNGLITITFIGTATTDINAKIDGIRVLLPPTAAIVADGNYFWQSNPGTWTTSFPFGTNTYSDPGFANPAGLPTTAPNCAKYNDTTDCMNGRYMIAANLKPSGGPLGKGYQGAEPMRARPLLPGLAERSSLSPVEGVDFDGECRFNYKAL
jgi:beta-galactosidase